MTVPHNLRLVEFTYVETIQRADCKDKRGFSTPVWRVSALKPCVVQGSDVFVLIYLFLAALGLHCCTQALSSCGEQGLLFTAVRGLLIAVASLVAEHRL